MEQRNLTKIKAMFGCLEQNCIFQWQTKSLNLFDYSLYIRTVLENASRNNFHEEFITIIEWKFQCQTCQRFVRTRFEDFLLKINAYEPNTFENHLNFFLQNKTCSCKQRSSAQPQLKQGRIPLKFSFTIFGFFLPQQFVLNV